MTARILYVTHRVPFPPDRGDRIRTWNILKFLAQRTSIDLACLADEAVTDATLQELQQVTNQLAIIPHSGRGRYVRGAISLLRGRTVTEGLFDSPALARVLQDWSRRTSYDAVLASSSGVARYVFPPCVKSSAKRWVDLIDVDSQKWLDYGRAAKLPMSLIYHTEGQRLRNVECRLAADCDRLLVVSEAERDLFRSFCPTATIHAVSNGVDYEYFAPQTDAVAEPHTCVFVGVMNYKPNADAVIWFAKQVWPEISQRYPGAKFSIVGKMPTPEVQALHSLKNIEVTGSVPDVRPWLMRATCAVVPLQIARGVQNKVLEAMACGRPVICSPEPLKGLAAVPGEHLLRADSASEWVAAISRVFDDKVLQQNLGDAAMRCVRQHYSWDSALGMLNELSSL
ncbi:MAG: TIGR03087 family PEP-CTERM/XrtA system glycosyltransferase [Planctomycetaceae bacterium]